jgi:hypothetical protein
MGHCKLASPNAAMSGFCGQLVPAAALLIEARPSPAAGRQVRRRAGQGDICPCRFWGIASNARWRKMDGPAWRDEIARYSWFVSITDFDEEESCLPLQADRQGKNQLQTFGAARISIRLFKDLSPQVSSETLYAMGDLRRLG